MSVLAVSEKTVLVKFACVPDAPIFWNSLMVVPSGPMSSAWNPDRSDR